MSKAENPPHFVQDSRAGKYLTFGLLATTAVPGMPEYMLGVINLRGKVIPVVDLRLKFHMSRAEATSETCIVVVDVHGTQTGVVVDRVSEVLDIRGEEIEDAPQMQGERASNYILGLAKARGRVKILLEVGKVMAETTFDAES